MAKVDDNLTPAMKQFHHFKQKYADAVLFFRMGDFYETFYEDAQTCSRVLGLTLTSRNKNSANPVPLAGLPYHAVDGGKRRCLWSKFVPRFSQKLEGVREMPLSQSLFATITCFFQTG